jgi:hypothetical protein
MPLTLVPPRKGRSRYWRIRGTIRGVYIDGTTGVESRELAEAIRTNRERQILHESIFGPRATQAVVSDDGEAIRLALYGGDGAVAAVTLAPVCAIALAGKLIEAALSRLSIAMAGG